MADERIKNYSNLLDKLKEQNKKREETIQFKRENIKKETDIVDLLEDTSRDYKYIEEMYDSVPREKIQSMSERKYLELESPLKSAIVSGETTKYLYEESYQRNFQSKQHVDTTTSINTMSSACATSLQVFSKSNPDWFPDYEKITHEYEIKDETNIHIKYIENYLQNHFPNIKDEFKTFISQFIMFRGNNSLYMNLIGARSLFFLKLIFGFSKNNYEVEYPRLEAIIKFVFGNNTHLPSAEPLLRTCGNIYSEMSEQDRSSDECIKLGAGNPAYIENLFIRLIGNIAAILKLRDSYFQE
ncbi:MAG: hypothetical protein A2149_00475 [Candidatus Schekmanbacteria bacterium RBG_16_38_11]|uniref:Uncharacterized protein n=1 Tax=Candidatus Schekmanbacteria bacterium RBG_16_38_11 TaxID=1817880 RepID=A0A1F7RRU6_9BACT|nr:MAG: hypothetical protein A2149_00475 [Candidatus Schekmanbacteria bacterium RBG_16_38_11]